jgi:hypothetical protein
VLLWQQLFNQLLLRKIMPKHLALSTDLVNAVLQYLGTRPFQEVHQIISAIQSEASSQMKEAEQVMEVGGTD